MELIGRKEAQSLGLSKYYTGKPCKYGHVSERWINNWECAECNPGKNGNKKTASYALQVARDNKELFYFTGIPCSKGHIAKRHTVTRGCVDCRTAYNEISDPLRTEYFKEHARLRLINNRAYMYAKNAKRRARKLRATPIWFEKDEIEKMFEGAQYLKRLTGITWDVDHIVPLNGRPYVWENGEITPEVCGLHVYANLQYLTRQDNIAKSNKLGV